MSIVHISANILRCITFTLKSPILYPPLQCPKDTHIYVKESNGFSYPIFTHARMSSWEQICSFCIFNHRC